MAKKYEEDNRVCRDCGSEWRPVRRGECIDCGSDAGAVQSIDWQGDAPDWTGGTRG